MSRIRHGRVRLHQDPRRGYTVNHVLRIEPAKPSDTRALNEIAKSTFALACPPDSDKLEIAQYVVEHFNERQFEQQLIGDDTPVFCAWADANIIGFLVLKLSNPCPINPSIRNAAQLRRLYVSASFHGTGASDLLMRAAFDVCKHHHQAAIWLSVFNKNLRAINFYAKYGFTKVGSTNFEMGHEIHLDDVMLASLTN